MSTTRNDLQEYDLESFYSQFNNESPRSKVILGASFLDALLNDLIQSFLILDEKNVKAFLEGPISGFGPRITLAYCLGLISKNELNDLRQIKDIRNMFAHQVNKYDFSNQDINKYIQKLILPNEFGQAFPKNLDTPEGRFVFSVTLLSTRLGVLILEAERNRLKPKDNIILADYKKLD